MKTLLALLLALPLAAQTVTVSLSGPATVRQGEPIAVTLTASPWVEAPKVAAHVALPFAFSQRMDGDLVLVCAPNGIDAGSNCWLAANTIPATGGPIAQYKITPPANAVGRYTLRLLGLMACGPDGVDYSVTPGPAYQVLIMDPADIDGDGIVTMTDVRMLIDEMIAGVKTHDQNGDGIIDLKDVFLLLKHVSGLVNQANVVRTLGIR